MQFVGENWCMIYVQTILFVYVERLVDDQSMPNFRCLSLARRNKKRSDMKKTAIDSSETVTYYIRGDMKTVQLRRRRVRFPPIRMAYN